MKKKVSPRKLEEKVIKNLESKRDTAFERFPLLFTILTTFGVVATFYGFERLIDKVDVFSQNPYILLGAGLITLIVTGALYKKLG